MISKFWNVVCVRLCGSIAGIQLAWYRVQHCYQVSVTLYIFISLWLRQIGVSSFSSTKFAVRSWTDRESMQTEFKLLSPAIQKSFCPHNPNGLILKARLCVDRQRPAIYKVSQRYPGSGPAAVVQDSTYDSIDTDYDKIIKLVSIH